jgi:hypothetical protein
VEWLRSFANMLRRIYERLARVVNGQISFGDGVNADNIDGVWASATTPGVANTDFVIAHNLGRVPVGYLPVRKSAATDIYTGTVAATTIQLTLKATGTNVDVTLFIF